MEWNLTRPEDMIATSPGSAAESMEEQIKRNVFFAKLEQNFRGYGSGWQRYIEALEVERES